MKENPPRTQSLASCYENALTIILRLSSLNQQSAANSQDFRTSIRAALKAAMEQAKALGYASEANQLAFFAVVSLLDESVLKLQSPAFADWAQRPLQEEMFGHNRAGEVFFDNLWPLCSRFSRTLNRAPQGASAQIFYDRTFANPRTCCGILETHPWGYSCVFFRASTGLGFVLK